MRTISAAELDRAFNLLEDCAVKGERCPISGGPAAHSFLRNRHTSALALAGRIYIEISTGNFRRVTLLTGKHAGRSTVANPNPNARVWQTIGAEGTKVNGVLQDRGRSSRVQPSAPRFLTAEELK